jgi:hypothetical protein
MYHMVNCIGEHIYIDCMERTGYFGGLRRRQHFDKFYGYPTIGNAVRGRRGDTTPTTFTLDNLSLLNRNGRRII